MCLEETGLPYEVRPINISKGEQLKPDFVAISPNNRIPAIVDRDPMGGGKPISIFESGAILNYLAEKSGKLLPLETRKRYAVLQWLMWQMGGLGPMAGTTISRATLPKGFRTPPIAISMKRIVSTVS